MRGLDDGKGETDRMDRADEDDVLCLSAPYLHESDGCCKYYRALPGLTKQAPRPIAHPYWAEPREARSTR